MIRALLRTNDSLAPLVLRLGLGSFAAWHAVASLGGSAFGEGGQTPYTAKLAQALSIHPALALPAALVLALGGPLLALGFMTRVIASLVLAALSCGLWTRYSASASEYGWLLAGEDPRAGMGLLVTAVVVSLVISGGGRLSLDRMATRTSARGGAHVGQ